MKDAKTYNDIVSAITEGGFPAIAGKIASKVWGFRLQCATVFTEQANCAVSIVATYSDFGVEYEFGPKGGTVKAEKFQL